MAATYYRQFVKSILLVLIAKKQIRFTCTEMELMPGSVILILLIFIEELCLCSAAVPGGLQIRTQTTRRAAISLNIGNTQIHQCLCADWLQV